MPLMIINHYHIYIKLPTSILVTINHTAQAYKYSIKQCLPLSNTYNKLNKVVNNINDSLYTAVCILLFYYCNRT